MNHSITPQFKPVDGQWELNDENIKRIDPKSGGNILHNYCIFINTTPLEVFKYLIKTLCCEVNLQDKYENTPIHNALSYFELDNGGDITVLTYLLSQGDVNVNIKGQYGFSLLHCACFNVNAIPLDVFEYMVEIQCCDVNMLDKDGNTPIHHALEQFDPDCCDLNVLTYLFDQKGVNVNTKGQSGRTLLHIACDYINSFPIEIFQYLITTKGADVHTQDSHNTTPIHYALRHFNPDEGGDIATLIYLLDQENVNTTAQDGHSLLHYVCGSINTLPIEIFKYLIEKKGCNLDVKCKSKRTPLHHAFYCFRPGCSSTILAYLLGQRDVNLSSIDQNGCTLLHLACILDTSGLRESCTNCQGLELLSLPAVISKTTDLKTDNFWSQMVEIVIKSWMKRVFDETAH
jgi:ankyrin repeat protein